jgi:predicted nucleic acid-binding protein
LDTEDAHHEAAVAAVERAPLAGRELITPASAYSEALVALARVGRVNDVRNAIVGMGIGVTPLTAAIAQRAAVLRATRGALRLPDAIVLATTLELDGELMTFDDRLGETRGRVIPLLPTARSIGAAGEPFACTMFEPVRPEPHEKVDTNAPERTGRPAGTSAKSLQTVHAGGGTRTPDTRIMIPLL